MLASDVNYLAQLLKRRTGIAINPSKTSQIAMRLAPVARRFGFRNTDELMRDLPHARESLVRTVIEAMTTNDTWFFRDRAPFEQFREIILPDLLSRRARSRKLRIWCAAASTGQEAYTLAMILAEARLAESGWSVELVASDINSECIARAKEGLYSSFEIQRGLSVKRLITYFTQENENWRICERLRRMVKFRVFNLLDDYGVFGEMDIIFCRNVLLYFEPQTKARVLERLSGTLAPDGYLVVGTAEIPHEITTSFERLPGTRGLYIKPQMGYRYAVL
ncbi:MAG TPA: protein-glutamate O-methyltransferase CheR [Rhizomicrobium sp.]|jgi:chemotaxis protein methyltransferase CheR|nr:protein-glutamate O-methyltransferase CheR [Rhizomicrobium sp.]